jgi:hypothetical protein
MMAGKLMTARGTDLAMMVDRRRSGALQFTLWDADDLRG